MRQLHVLLFGCASFLAGCLPVITPLPVAPPCDSDADCAAGYYCDAFESRCLVDDRDPPFTFDAGPRPDAGLDAGVPDAAALDAGLDAGAPDAAPADAGPQNPENPTDVTVTLDYGEATVLFTYPAANADSCDVRRQLGPPQPVAGVGDLVATVSTQGPVVDADAPFETDVSYTVFCEQGGLVATVAVGNSIGPVQVKYPWHYPGWQKRHRVRFNNMSRPVADLAPFVVPVFVDATNFPAVASATNTGADLRFADPDGTLLPFDVEGWTQGTTSGVFWVRVPVVDAGSNMDGIFIYYGNAAALPEPNPTAVWTDHLSVLHFNQVADNAIGGLVASGNGILPSAEVPDGQVLGSYLFSSATAGQLTLSGGTAALPAFTLTGWVKIRNLASNQSFFNIPGGLFVGRNGGTTQVRVQGNIGGTNFDASGGEVQTLGPFHHVAVTYDGLALTLFVDAVPITVVPASGELAANAGPITIGGGTTFFDGWFDEVRFSTAARSAEWVEADREAGQNLFIDPTRDEEEDVALP